MLDFFGLLNFALANFIILSPKWFAELTIRNVIKYSQEFIFKCLSEYEKTLKNRKSSPSSPEPELPESPTQEQRSRPVDESCLTDTQVTQPPKVVPSIKTELEESKVESSLQHQEETSELVTKFEEAYNYFTNALFNPQQNSELTGISCCEKIRNTSPFKYFRSVSASHPRRCARFSRAFRSHQNG